jgi:hypothetical protein
MRRQMARRCDFEHDGTTGTTIDTIAMTDDESAAAHAEVFKHFERSTVSGERMRRLKEWAVSLVCWDGLLPIAVLAIPNLVALLLPNCQGIIAMLGVTPVVALSVRFVIGWKRMKNGKSYGWQTIVFTFAISALFLFEAFLLNDQIGGGPKIADPTGLLVMFLSYLVTMAVALFPFRRAERSADIG